MIIITLILKTLHLPRRIWDTLHWHKGFKSTFLQKSGKSNSFLFSILIKMSFFIFSGLRQKQKQDKVDFGNDRENNIIEDLNTLSALYYKTKSNVNSLNQ